MYRCRFVLLQTNINGFDYNIVKTVSISGERYGDIESYITEGDQRWFGALPFVSGTLLTSLLALLISLPFSLAIAVFLGEYFTSGIVSDVLKTTNELLAGIPSIIYGFWAFKFVAPLVYELFPYSDGGGSNILTASIVLAIMIIPYSASLSREVINMVPNDLKEAAYAMGATRYEVVKRVIVPYSSSGIVAGTLLAFGRALGETMAVTLVIGNKNEIPQSIFSSGQTIASLIASKYAEGGRMQIAALTELGLILFVITLVFGLLGRYLIKKLSVR
ncbi:MAG: phosphate ABC transporter permease subunit PstC [Spirochaetes bacterium GWF1_51_8]|nr:MAG: phosphate ABC transporter permease subunit PstC [Spirochaetes bacterium GWF1_51_8]